MNIYTYADLNQTQVSDYNAENGKFPIINMMIEDLQVFLGALLNYLDKTVIVLNNNGPKKYLGVCFALAIPI